MNYRYLLLFIIALQSNFLCALTIQNNSGKEAWVAIYTKSSGKAGHVVRITDPIKIAYQDHIVLQLPAYSFSCNHYIIAAHDIKKLVEKISLHKVSHMAAMEVGCFNWKSMLGKVYLAQEHGTLGIYNPLSYLKINQQMSLDQFAQSSTAETLLPTLPLYKKNIYKDDVATVRVSSDPCEQEVQYVEKRTEHVRYALEQLTGRKLNGNYIPKIALINSGGGDRSLVSMTGFYMGAHNKGLLDAVTYVAGVSGGAWMIALWLQYGKDITLFKETMRSVLQSFPRGATISALTIQEYELFVKSILARIIYKQPITLVNFWGSFLATYHLGPYKNDRHAQFFSEVAPIERASRFPFPILTTTNGDDSDTAQKRHYMRWFEYTPYEAGAVGDWLGNAFVPTWGFGRAYNNGTSIDFSAQYDTGLLMGMCGAAFAFSFARAYQELIDRSGLFGFVLRPIIESLLSQEKIAKNQNVRASAGQVHNFTFNMQNSPYKDVPYLKMVDAGLAFNMPYPPVSGHGVRTADIMIFLDASERVESTGPEGLIGAQDYASSKQLPFPSIPPMHIIKNRALEEPIMLFREEEIKVPVVGYMSRFAHHMRINYGPEIPPGYTTLVPTLKFHYTPQEFDQISMVTQKNMEYAMKDIVDIIIWDIERHNGFVDCICPPESKETITEMPTINQTVLLLDPIKEKATTSSASYIQQLPTNRSMVSGAKYILSVIVGLMSSTYLALFQHSPAPPLESKN